MEAFSGKNIENLNDHFKEKACTLNDLRRSLKIAHKKAKDFESEAVKRGREGQGTDLGFEMELLAKQHSDFARGITYAIQTLDGYLDECCNNPR